MQITLQTRSPSRTTLGSISFAAPSLCQSIFWRTSYTFEVLYAHLAPCITTLSGQYWGQRCVDGPISVGLFYFGEFTFTMLARFFSVMMFTPIFMITGVFVAVLGTICSHLSIKAQLSVKREMSTAKAPVLGRLGAAVSGLVSLRAYGAQEAFTKESMKRIDRYTRAASTFYNLTRWVCVRVDAMGGLFAAGLAAYLVYFKSHGASNTGFPLNMAVGFSGMILWWIQRLNELEVHGNSLERIEKYTNIEQEPNLTEGGIPPAYWPSSGKLEVENLSARYSPDGPKVLQGISFSIRAGESIGIVGRTGSGKSSLTLALLRCIFAEGRALYDGIDTSKINLDSLRSNITIIPQIPELLSGTLRQNLDPFDQYDDATLNSALRSSGLFSLHKGGDDEGRVTLDSPISTGGSNLSVGQRQVLALARAIVRGSKLLILDEATFAIDNDTDAIIQSSLRHELGPGVTVITVAHRLHTIMDADKIMVLDAGKIVESDKPGELLRDPKGKLRALVGESGDREHLFELANFQQ
ncbi:P-loop containing nucleoside triphosphate hydrolase protein [Coprinellus micaceus]|uniref:P-loop containing nucleoside triphosphate hydrolase protein n=1 Tax=Coprinellus micaceus TaxID=71717 RepID=A0A4Y7TY13_COPMI|nr:P-loop containing nucleoside triphosphate hydrolase protein [Coprinellus micaceus]